MGTRGKDWPPPETKKPYELWFLVNFLNYKHPAFWLYYGRYRTHKGAADAARANRYWQSRCDIEHYLTKVQSSFDAGVSFYSSKHFIPTG